MSTKKKILFVITKSNWGGAQRYVFDLATSLPLSRFEPVVAVGGNGPLVQKLKERGVRTISISSLTRDMKLLEDVRSFLELYRIFETERPDIVHLNSSKAAGLGALAARFAGVPSILFTAHGWPFKEERPLYQRLLIKIASYITTALSTTTVCVSKEDASIAKNWALVGNKVKLVHLGISPFNLHEKTIARNYLASYIKRDPDFLSNKKIVGFLGELHPNKGILDIHSRLIFEDNTIYVSIGEGEERKKIEEQIKNQNLENTFFLAGFIDNAAKFLSAFDIFVLPSKKEGLPYVILEAGLAGLPTLATSVGGIPDVVEENESGYLFKPNDYTSFREKLALLMQEEGIREKFGRNLLHKVEKEFTLEKMVRETIFIYEKA